MIKVSIDSKVMKSALSGLVDHLKNKIDLDSVKKVCKEQYGIETIEGVEAKDGAVVVINDQVACRIDFIVRFPMSIFVTDEEKSKSITSQDNIEALEPDEVELIENGDDLEIIENDEETLKELPPIDMKDLSL